MVKENDGTVATIEKVETNANVTEKLAPKPDKLLGIRHLQGFLIFLGLILAYGIRVCMSVGIVAMTESAPEIDIVTFDWSKQIQDLILSSFFWGYVVSQVPGGLLAERFGGKYPLLVSLAANGIVCLILPISAISGGWGAVCGCRVVQGLFQGMFYPSTHALLGRWAPLPERGRLSTFVYGGAQLGTVIALLITGELCGSWGWPAAFYTFGIASLIWITLWFFLGANNPDESRFISSEERDYIKTSLGQEGERKKMLPPWGSIFRSLPVWALIVAHCGQSWGFWMLLTEMPSYMKLVLGVDIKSNGQLSALPYFVMWLLSFVASFLSDFVINRKICSVTVARKVANTIGQWGPGLALIGLSYAPADITVAVALLTITVGMNAAHHVGFNVNHIDLAPNFAGTLMGITNGAANILSIIAPLSVGFILNEENQGKAEAWRPIFFLSSAIYFLCNLFWLLFGTSEMQPWNDPIYNDKTKDKERANAVTNDAVTMVLKSETRTSNENKDEEGTRY